MCGNNYLNDNQQYLVLEHISLAYKVANRYMANRKYEDIVQACLLGLCEAALTWAGNIPFETYAITYIRRNARKELALRPEVPLLSEPVADEVIPIITDIKETLAKIIEAKLTNNEKMVIKLRYPLDASRAYSDAQIAIMLEKSATWVSKQRKNAIGQLKIKLGG